MHGGRRNLRKHIRAARDWLSRADDSLGRENDAAGELHLMLARAEMQRASESTKPRTFLRRALPLCTAAIIAAVGFSIWHHASTQPVTEPPLEVQPVETTEVHAAVPPQEQAVTKDVSNEKYVPVVAKKQETVYNKELVLDEKAQQAQQQPAETRRDTVKPAPPDEAVQKLMRQAGRTLKAQ